MVPFDRVHMASQSAFLAKKRDRLSAVKPREFGVHQHIYMTSKHDVLLKVRGEYKQVLRKTEILGRWTCRSANSKEKCHAIQRCIWQQDRQEGRRPNLGQLWKLGV